MSKHLHSEKSKSEKLQTEKFKSSNLLNALNFVGANFVGRPGYVIEINYSKKGISIYVVYPLWWIQLNIQTEIAFCHALYIDHVVSHPTRNVLYLSFL